MSKGPYLTVDCVVFSKDGKVLVINRKNEPLGWAFPGGIIDASDKSIRYAAFRELVEETGVSDLTEENIRFYTIMGNINRDPRGHYMTFVYTATINKNASDIKVESRDDARDASFQSPQTFLKKLVFDHAAIYEKIVSENRLPQFGGSPFSADHAIGAKKSKYFTMKRPVLELSVVPVYNGKYYSYKQEFPRGDLKYNENVSDSVLRVLADKTNENYTQVPVYKGFFDYSAGFISRKLHVVLCFIVELNKAPNNCLIIDEKKLNSVGQTVLAHVRK